jgi:hypothetical protein
MGLRDFCRDCVSPLSIFSVVSIVAGVVVAWIALAKNLDGIAGGLTTEAAGVLVGTGLIEAALAEVQRARSRQERARSVEIHFANESLSVDELRVSCDLTAPNRSDTVAFDLVLTFNMPVELTRIVRPNASGLGPYGQTVLVGERVPLEANEFHHVGLLDSGQTLFYSIGYSADVSSPQFVLRWSLPVRSTTPAGRRQKYNGFLPDGDWLKRAKRQL